MTMATQHTLLLVDDQSIFMDGMEALLGRIPEVQIVGKANNGADAVALVHELKPTLVLMDINMPGMDGIEASKRILKANPDTRILVLSMYGHKEFVLELMDSGVSGYLLKTTGKDELIEALSTGAAGKKYLARELRTILARNPRLKVAAPTSSSAIEAEDDFAIGRKLGVGHILRGSVQRDTARVRVTAELVAIKDGLVRWAETYDRALEDVFAVQSEIAETVALSLVAEVATDSEAAQAAAAQKDIGGTQSVAAYEAFLRGASLYSLSVGEDTDRAALAQFEAAIDQDPSYAAAYAMRSTALAAIANAASDTQQNRRFYAEAITAAERAIAIEPKLALGHLALGFALNNGQLRRSAAAGHYRAAQQLAPGDADVLRGAATFQSYGKDQALAGQMIARVLALDPLNPRAFQAAGFIALFARDYPVVVNRMQRALQLNPGSPGAYFGIAIARLLQGDAAGGLAAAAQEPVLLFRLTATAIAAGKQRETASADAALEALIRDYGDASLYQQAQINAQLGAVEPAMAALEQAFAMRDSGVLWAPNDALLDPLRAEPRFKDLLIRLGS